MLLAMLVLAASAAHPLETLRLTPDQMFHLQVPYRYKVSIAEIGRDGLGRWELQVADYYCNGLRQLEIRQEPIAPAPPTMLRRNAVRGRMILKLDDIVWFPDDRYAHLDSLVLDADGEYLLVIMDRQEKRVLWPLEPPSP